MNLPNSVVRHILSTVALIFRSMAYRFADHCNDRRLTEGQFLRRTSVKRKPCGSPTKNGCANLTPLRLCWYFTDNDTGEVERYAVARYLASPRGPVPERQKKELRDQVAPRMRGAALFSSL